jgi:hypothetical protein
VNQRIYGITAQFGFVGGQSGGGLPPSAKDEVDKLAASSRMVPASRVSFRIAHLLEWDLRRRMDQEWMAA